MRVCLSSMCRQTLVAEPFSSVPQGAYSLPPPDCPTYHPQHVLYCNNAFVTFKIVSSPLQHQYWEHYCVLTKNLDASYRPTLCSNVLKPRGKSKRSQTQKEQLEVIDKYSSNLQAVEKPRPKPPALNFEGHVTDLQVLSRGRRTLRQTVHLIPHMNVPNSSKFLTDTDAPGYESFVSSPSL